MADEAVHFESVEIRRFLGIRRARDLLAVRPGELAPGVNLVHGPNGAGKTTMARALEALLWPQAWRRETPSLSAVARVGGERWMIDVDVGRTEYRRDGETSTFPALPPDETRGRYRLDLHELLRAEDTELAAQILREINGGLDLAAALAAVNEGRPGAPSRRGREYTRLRDAGEQVRRLTGEQGELERQERQLASLKDAIGAAREAADRVVCLDAVQAWQQAVAAARDAAETIATFPSVMSELAGDEAERVAECDEMEEAAARAVAAARERRETALKAIADSGFGSTEAPSEQLLTSLEQRRDTIAELTRTRKELERALPAASAGETQARAEIGEQVTDAQLQALATVGASEFPDFIQDSELYRGRRARLGLVKAWFAGDSAPDPEALAARSRAVRVLRQWLRQAAPGVGTRRATRVIQALAALGLLVTGVLAFMVHWLWAVAGVIWIVLAAVGLRRRAAGQDRQEITAEFPAGEVALPKTWEADAVRARLDELEQEIADGRVAAARAACWETFRRPEEAELAELEQRLADRRDVLLQRFGAAPGIDALQLQLLAGAISRWQTARAVRQDAETRLDTCRAQQQTEVDAFSTQVASFGVGPVSDAPSVAGCLQELRRRGDRCREGQRELESAERDLTRLRGELAQARSRRKQLLHRCGVEPGGDDASRAAARRQLRDLLQRRPAFLKAQEVLLRADHERGQRRRAMEQHCGYEPAIEALSAEELATARRLAAEQAEGREALENQYHGIQAKAAAVREQRSLEAALAEQTIAEQELRRLRERVCAGRAAEMVAAHLRSRTQKSASRVLQQARRRFATITRHAYELQVSDGPPASFSARDTRTGRVQALAELSSGTRVQLLLAARMGFIESQEEGRLRPPLILDEILGNSDDARARAVIEAVLEFAREGRQIFYFTAQQDELGKWLGILAEQADVEHQTIALPGRDAVETIPLRIERPHAPDIPKPGDGESYREYGRRLGVPPFDPASDTFGATHLWHLLTDAQQLYGLLEHGYATWGQLDALIRQGGAEAVAQLGLSDDPGFVARVAARARALQSLAAGWRVGRGRPVERQVLLDSEAVSDVYIDELAALAAAAGGDAWAVIQALEDRQVRGFQRRKVEQLRDYLLDHGCLDPRPVRSVVELSIELDVAMAAEVAEGSLSPSDLRDLVAKLPAAHETGTAGGAGDHG